MKKILCTIFLLSLIPTLLNAENEYELKLNPDQSITYSECYTAEQIKIKEENERKIRNVAVSIAANVGIICLAQEYKGYAKHPTKSEKNIHRCIQEEFSRYGWGYITKDEIKSFK